MRRWRPRWVVASFREPRGPRGPAGPGDPGPGRGVAPGPPRRRPRRLLRGGGGVRARHPLAERAEPPAGPRPLSARGGRDPPRSAGWEPLLSFPGRHTGRAAWCWAFSTAPRGPAPALWGSEAEGSLLRPGLQPQDVLAGAETKSPATRLFFPRRAGPRALAKWGDVLRGGTFSLFRRG